jgi:hypothetical protein
MSKTEPFHVRNNEWIIMETKPGVFTLVLADESQKITGLTAKQLVAANAVVSELDRYLHAQM